MKADGSRLIPRKHTETLVLLRVYNLNYSRTYRSIDVYLISKVKVSILSQKAKTVLKLFNEQLYTIIWSNHMTSSKRMTSLEYMTYIADRNVKFNCGQACSGFCLCCVKYRLNHNSQLQHVVSLCFVLVIWPLQPFVLNPRQNSQAYILPHEAK